MRVLDRIGEDGIGSAWSRGYDWEPSVWPGERDSRELLILSAQSWPKQLQLYPFDAAPIDRFDSFDVVFGVFLVQDLALFCSIFICFVCIFCALAPIDGSNRATKGTTDTL